MCDVVKHAFAMSISAAFLVLIKDLTVQVLDIFHRRDVSNVTGMKHLRKLTLLAEM